MPQTREELRDRVVATARIFGDILGNLTAWNNLGAEKRQQLTTGINKAYGQAMSFLHEYLTTLSAENKGRTVVTQTHADVTVGAADALFAKSVECKNVTKPEKGAVNKVIGDALEQLSGQTGHNPRAGDVRVVDIKIDGTYNPWPLPGGAYGTNRTPATTNDIRTQAVAELKDIVNANKAGAKAVKLWLAGETLENFAQLGRLRDVTDSVQPIPGLPPIMIKRNPNSTRPIFQDTAGKINKIRCLTIKIRYEQPYLLSDAMPPNQFKGLQEIVVQVYTKPTGLTIETAKIKAIVTDFSNILAPTSWTVRE